MNKDFIVGFLWFYILQPLIFLFGISVFAVAVVQYIWS
jgi:hypothetical protein